MWLLTTMSRVRPPQAVIFFAFTGKIEAPLVLIVSYTMLTDFQNNVLTAIGYIAYYGVLYFGVLAIVYSSDSPYSSRIKNEAANTPSQEPLSTLSDPILQADSVEAKTDTYAITASSEKPVVDSSHHDSSIGLVKFDDTPVPYRHELWPSPRPVNFVKAILDDEPNFKVNGRLAHVKAVDILAERAFMTRREFLRTNPITYSQRFMKGMNALYLLKGSIDRLEYLLREESYKQQLRLHENGKNRCPLY